jgi:hypothetical protein
MRLFFPRRLREWAGIGALLASCICLVGLLVVLYRYSLTTSQRISVLYNWPPYSIGFFWLFCRLKENTAFRPVNLALDALIVSLAASRFFGSYIPTSGHALLMSYSLLTTASRVYRVLAALMLALTIAMKLSWGDRWTWVSGILAGTAGGLAYRRWPPPVAKSPALR